MRQYIGPPSTVGAVESVISMFSFAAFVLNAIALSAPNWREFAIATTEEFSIGLWAACGGNGCVSAWGKYSPFIALNGQNQIKAGWYYADNTPPKIASSQAFFFAGLLLHLLSCCCWAGGAGVAALSLALPAVCYTIGTSLAANYFMVQDRSPLANIFKLEWGYAAECAFAGVIMVWLAVLAFAVDYMVRATAQHLRKRNAAATRRGEAESNQYGHGHGNRNNHHDAVGMEEMKPVSLSTDIEALGGNKV